MTHVTAGGIAGGIAAAVTTPLDVAKVSLYSMHMRVELMIDTTSD